MTKENKMSKISEKLKDQPLTPVRHTAEHILHTAAQELYPDLLKVMGPVIEEGFYFDFDLEQKLSIEDLPKIEAKMQEIIKADLPISKKEVTVKEAKKIFKNNPYKQEWLKEIEERGELVIFYEIGKEGDKYHDLDLCSGPHAKSTGEVKAFKLLSISGAYWKGDEKNKMLQRIYGTAFNTQEELDEYLNRLEEAKKRDHRKIGKEQELFVFSDLVGKGLPLFTEKGATIWREIERFVVDEEIKRGYQHVNTPNLAKTDLYKKSGHYPYYKDTMYPPMSVDEEEIILRPMTCPHHFALYMSKPRSYRELPLRYAELASLYRYEKSGELTGLLRVREFCLADSHNFVREDQAESEIHFVLDLIEYATDVLGFKKGEDYIYRLSLGDPDNKEKFFDSPKEWKQSEEVLRKVLKDRSAPFYEAEKEAAFYGPKIDVQMKNVLGKEDTAFTVQYDFCLPQRFELKYINEQGGTEQPVVIHRSSIGAMERTIGFLIEKHAGAFPVWLSPMQVKIIPISDKHLEFASQVKEMLKNKGVRVEIDGRNDTMQAKIRGAQNEKIPYMLIIGDREVENNQVSVRLRTEEDLGALPVADVIEKISNKYLTKAQDLW
jgi:threonyl-tRNA synthetase